MSWVTPGEPIEVEIEGKVIKVKALSPSEKREFGAKLETFRDTEKDEELMAFTAEYVVEIPGYEGDIAEFLGYQPAQIVGQINVAIRFSGLMPEQRKN